MKIACDVLGIARSNIYERKKEKSEVRQRKTAKDEVILEKIKKTVRDRPFYGYRRVTAMLNKKADQRINQKRVYRIMGENNLLLQQAPKSLLATTTARSLPWRRTCDGAVIILIFAAGTVTSCE